MGHQCRSFVLFSLLSFTGVIHWLILPKGYGTRSGFLVSLRHSLVEVYEWTSLLFMIIIVIHIMLHWSYIKTHLKKYGFIK
ncbi:MAG: DUF4405 domain-containing protein [Deltaproteobacteria bacterium]|nr:DUF4405 domain-containing protein [Deltaproteobacteria bacterium]MBW2019321.1 DUF4405 domain-containing protein [Deltaproteobacteria bacterium]MBW2074369.1 DUF4405 domain-containing protein [Deltaproteobacteria bacterium]